MNASRIKLVGVALGIFVVTVWLHWPSVHGEFLDVDDKEYLRQSERWNGLTWNAVKWAFTSMDPYYHPLPRLSHVLDYQLWGKNAAGHHATSVFLHALNAALVFGFLWTLLGAVSLTTGERLAMALGVTVAFAIHPFQVESVAWMSGRTQLLCATFGIGCLWAYAAGARRWVVWGLFALALLCKPTAVSLPFAMLAMDYFPLRRHERFGWGRLLWEKAAMIALAGGGRGGDDNHRGWPGSMADGSAVGPRVDDVSIPGVLSVAAGVSMASIPVLSVALAPFAGRVEGRCVSARRRGDYGPRRVEQATPASAGGGLGGIHRVCSSRLRADARIGCGGATACIRSDAAAATVGRRSGSMGVAAFDDGRACRPGRLAGVRTVRLRGTRSQPDTGVAQRRNATAGRIGVVPGLGI